MIGLTSAVTSRNGRAEVRIAEDAWNTRDPARVRWLTRRIVAGAIASNFCKAGLRSRRS